MKGQQKNDALNTHYESTWFATCCIYYDPNDIEQYSIGTNTDNIKGAPHQCSTLRSAYLSQKLTLYL